MKILTVAGARPQFVKVAVVSEILRKKHKEVLVHTGQHFDYNMSQQFFDELDIPTPDYNLGISGGTHAQMTGRMLIGIEEVLVREKPDWLLVYGDTNSTLAAALAAVKLHIPVCHAEAGTRTHCMTNPEEINRICVDHVSSLLLACTTFDMQEMEREGLLDRAELVGDPMYDAFLKYSGKIRLSDITLSLIGGGESGVPDEYYYLTCHREENTNDDNLCEIMKAMECLDAPVVYPVHPRNVERIMKLKKKHGFHNLILANPVGYLESNCLVKNARKIITDSGGLQREAFFAGKQCVTVLNHITWAATMVDNRNQLARPECEDILVKLSNKQHVDESYQPFGDGNAAVKIVQALENYNTQR